MGNKNKQLKGKPLQDWLDKNGHTLPLEQGVTLQELRDSCAQLVIQGESSAA